MKYRNFGSRIDFKPSALGFGAMRFPTIGNDSSNIIEKNAIKMMRYAVDNGVNYIDTAWPYHDGNSEKIVAKALKDGYRDKVKIATKLPSWELEKVSDLDYYLDKQLEKLEIDTIDFYLLHALNKDHFETYKKLDVKSWINKVKKQSKIKYIGFSFHDDLQTFKNIVDYYDKWDFCQIQYNYLNTDYQAGKTGLQYAADKGLGVIIMEPLLGGRLAEEQPVPIQKIFNSADIDRTPADWALQWLWNQPEVSLVLSGMSNLTQVKENIESASNSGINSLSSDELKVIKKVKNKYEDLSPIACTGCGYCLPCPNGVNIPGNFTLYNEAKVNEKFDEKNIIYNNRWDNKVKASNCVACGACEPQCPQNLEIINLLEKVDNYFAKN
ncbi:MAG: aldo/keto reductase [bacterium]